eukprot:6486527-Amphidinium_carterae.2
MFHTCAVMRNYYVSHNCACEFGHFQNPFCCVLNSVLLRGRQDDALTISCRCIGLCGMTLKWKTTRHTSFRVILSAQTMLFTDSDNQGFRSASVVRNLRLHAMKSWVSLEPWLS